MSNDQENSGGLQQPVNTNKTRRDSGSAKLEQEQEVSNTTQPAREEAVPSTATMESAKRKESSDDSDSDEFEVLRPSKLQKSTTVVDSEEPAANSDKGKGKAPEPATNKFASYAAAFQNKKAQENKSSAEQVMGLLFQNGIPSTTGGAFNSVAQNEELFGDAPADVDSSDFYALRFETARFAMGDFVSQFEALQSEYSKVLRTAHASGGYRRWLEGRQRQLEAEFIASSARPRFIRGG